WIAGALESAVGQTYEELEIVVADNASTDATVELARAVGDPRIRVESTPQTIGAVANHNRAIRLSHGAFVKFLHADDLLLPPCLATGAALGHVGLLTGRLFQIADLELWARIMVSCRVGFVDRFLSVYRHHGESGTARNARVQRDWFDQPWLLEGLLAIPDLT